MTVTYGMSYTRPVLHGNFIVDRESSMFDWVGMSEWLFMGAGFVLLIVFGDVEMWKSFALAFIVAFVLSR